MTTEEIKIEINISGVENMTTEEIKINKNDEFTEEDIEILKKFNFYCEIIIALLLFIIIWQI